MPTVPAPPPPAPPVVFAATLEPPTLEKVLTFCMVKILPFVDVMEPVHAAIPAAKTAPPPPVDGVPLGSPVRTAPRVALEPPN